VEGDFQGFKHPILVEVVGSAVVGLILVLIEKMIGLFLGFGVGGSEMAQIRSTDVEAS
jgi:hypothetical protein